MTGCIVYDHFSKLLNLMGSEDSFTLSRESLSRILEQHAEGGCCTGPAEPPESSASSSMGLSTADLAEAMGTSEATAGRRIRAGWFGEPERLRPNGAHYCVPHDVAEDVFKNGPLSHRGRAVEQPASPETEIGSETPDRGPAPTEAHRGAQGATGVATAVEVPSGNNERRKSTEAKGRRAPTCASPDGADKRATREASGADGTGSSQTGAERENLRAVGDTEGAVADSPASALVDLLGDWREVYREDD